MSSNTLTPDLCQRIDAYWRAANYLSVGQIYLYDNPLLRRPLALADIKHMLLGHWGTTPGQNFIYVHLNRVIKKYDLDMIYVSGSGHGGPAVVANTYLEGTYSEVRLQKLFRQFSFPGGIPSHASPECPGSNHEGGELGYSLSHSRPQVPRGGADRRIAARAAHFRRSTCSRIPALAGWAEERYRRHYAAKAEGDRAHAAPQEEHQGQATGRARGSCSNRLMSKGIIALDADGVLLDYGLAYAGAWQKAFGQYPRERDPLAY